MYKPLPDFLTIKKSLIHGLGLFAIADIKANTNLGITHIKHADFDDSYIRTPLGGFVNHQNENFNCKFEGNEILNLYTIQDIKNGEELTAFYTLYNPTLK